MRLRAQRACPSSPRGVWLCKTGQAPWQTLWARSSLKAQTPLSSKERSFLARNGTTSAMSFLRSDDGRAIIFDELEISGPCLQEMRAHPICRPLRCHLSDLRCRRSLGCRVRRPPCEHGWQGSRDGWHLMARLGRKNSRPCSRLGCQHEAGQSLREIQPPPDSFLVSGIKSWRPSWRGTSPSRSAASGMARMLDRRASPQRRSSGQKH